MNDSVHLNQLAAEVACLRAGVARLRDESDIRRLQYLYGYFVDEGAWDRLMDFFADDCSVDIGLRGTYIGKNRVGRFFREVATAGRSNRAFRMVYNHLQVQMVVTVADDRASACARCHALLQGYPGHGNTMMWAEGAYENRYVRIDGNWRISSLVWSANFYSLVSGIEKIFFDGTGEDSTFPPDGAGRPIDADSGRQKNMFHFWEGECRCMVSRVA